MAKIIGQVGVEGQMLTEGNALRLIEDALAQVYPGRAWVEAWSGNVFDSRMPIVGVCASGILCETYGERIGISFSVPFVSGSRWEGDNDALVDLEHLAGNGVSDILWMNQGPYIFRIVILTERGIVTLMTLTLTELVWEEGDKRYTE